MNPIVSLGAGESSATRLVLTPLQAGGLRDQAYAVLKDAIARIDIYGEPRTLRLDERQLVLALGVSRTPIREALTILEQEGFVRTVPRRGIFIVRKSKRQIIEMIQRSGPSGCTAPLPRESLLYQFPSSAPMRR